MNATITDMPPIDTRHIVDILEEAIELLEGLDGKDVSDTEASRKMKVNAEVNRELLYIQHLCDKASVETMTVYHAHRRDR